MDKKKILVLSIRHRGGLPIFAYEIVKLFPHESYNVLISKYSAQPYEEKNTIVLNYYKKIIDFIPKTLFYFPLFIVKNFKTFKRDFDVLYIPYGSLWGTVIFFIFKKLNKPVIFTVHDAIRHSGEESFIYKIISNYKIKNADKLIFLTNHQRDLAVAAYKLNQPTAIIPHGLYNFNGIIPKKREGKPVILFLGRIIKYKGVELLCKAFLEVKDHFESLIIAGNPNYDVQIPKSDQIESHLKYLSEEEMVKILNRSDILVLPYLEATQSGVLTIGIQSEKPMICTKVGGLREQLEEDECLFIEPEESQLISALLNLAQDEKLFNKLKSNLIKKKDSLSWEKISELTLNFIQN